MEGVIIRQGGGDVEHGGNAQQGVSTDKSRSGSQDRDIKRSTALATVKNDQDCISNTRNGDDGIHLMFELRFGRANAQIPCCFDPRQLIRELKIQLEPKVEIPARDQLWEHAGVLLLNDDTLRARNIGGGSVISVREFTREFTRE
ncbi:hypothetical protein BsWGS_19044 [Bradybaena similaris]